jgi:hypothetical protein
MSKKSEGGSTPAPTPGKRRRSEKQEGNLRTQSSVPDEKIKNTRKKNSETCKKKTSKAPRVTIVPYKAEHLMEISLQEAQKHLAKYVTAEHAKALEMTDSYTAMCDGKPIGCGGLLRHWPGRSELWSYLSDDVTPKVFMQIHHAVQRFVDVNLEDRMEAYVDVNFGNGHRWVRALGFQLQCPRLDKYWPGGRDAALYVRIR